MALSLLTKLLLRMTNDYNDARQETGEGQHRSEAIFVSQAKNLRQRSAWVR